MYYINNMSHRIETSEYLTIIYYTLYTLYTIHIIYTVDTKLYALYTILIPYVPAVEDRVHQSLPHQVAHTVAGVHRRPGIYNINR